MKTLASSLIALSLLACVSAQANEELPVAPADLVQELTEMCLDWAKDDDVQASELKKYVLNCVNDELDATGYQKVKDVDIK
ncbi:hypothetical protein [Pseudoalteromonas piscicida]|uniref:Uncharacterized protein n=1 Tax=Pseudoalteromonas piscicida TaxID=43662 RepID=A0A2A5JQZ2_PSEO7|nr:hypothetical protein [Pseudoalteromonas piscicida]PCK31845.1 hypothetical protein CEX98_10125 [Pseudoalteromonas piscicida]